VRVLLVEDDPMNVELFVDVLEQAGHDVVVEKDGVAGRDRALAERFDLCIFDVHLPRLRGDDAVRDLRKRGMASRVIALTSSALTEEVKRGIGAGFDAYLTKPISPASLRSAIEMYGTKG
jgi:two-component system cell cycle response regulator DivK